MTTRRVPDGEAVTNHYTASFPPHIIDGNFLSVSGLADETEIIEGPDKRGYATGQASKQTLTVVLATNDPGCAAMHTWKEKTEHGAPDNRCVGTVTVSDNGGNVRAIFELEDCLCNKTSHSDLKIDGAEVAQETFEISYSRCRRLR